MEDTINEKDSLDESIYYKFSVDDLITMNPEASILKEQYHQLAAEKGICHIPVEDKKKSGLDIRKLLRDAAVLAINKKIQNLNVSSRKFTSIDNEIQAQSSLAVLTDIMDHYKYYLDDADYLEANLVRVECIKEEAQRNSDFYQKEAEDRLERKGLFRLNKNAEQTFDTLRKQFEGYRMELYLFAYATFLEVMLSQSFDGQYLDDTIRLLRNYAYRYRDVYSECYKQLESYQRSAVESQVLKAGAGVSHILGKGIARIPVINKGPVDEKLIELGDTISDYDEKQIQKGMENFRKNKESGMNVFIENLIIVKTLCNNTGELLWDEEYLYVKKPVVVVS